MGMLQVVLWYGVCMDQRPKFATWNEQESQANIVAYIAVQGKKLMKGIFESLFDHT